MPKPAKKNTKTTFTWDEVVKLNAGERLTITTTKGGSTDVLLDETVDAGKKLTVRLVAVGELK